MAFKCRTCGQIFETIPDGSVEARKDNHYTTFIFPDGRAHDLRRLPKEKSKPVPSTEEK
jgi:hypothetical protein